MNYDHLSLPDHKVLLRQTPTSSTSHSRGLSRSKDRSATIMREEISAAALYIASLHAPAPPATFAPELERLLEARYRGHWHADDPERGSAYRCLAQQGHGRPEKLVQKAFEASGVEPIHSRVARWTVFVDPGCVSAKLGDSAEFGALKEIWGTLPSYSPAAPEPSPAALVDALPNFVSPAKRLSKAIQIVRPDSRQAIPPFTPGSHVSIIPPTPATARPAMIPQPSFAPSIQSPQRPPSASDRSITPTVQDPFMRPESRSSQASSSDGGHSSDLGSERESVFSATSHETLFPALSHMSGVKRTGYVGGHHRHTSSVSTTASSNSTGTSASSISRPTSAGSGSIVQEHSNGKVGVLGGGVLLGVPSSSTSGDESPSGNHGTIRPSRARGRGRSRARSANYHASQQQQAIMSGRWPFPDATMAF